MQTSLDRRVSALEMGRRADEGTTMLVFATGKTCVILKDFFKKFLAEKRPPGSVALPVPHDPD